MKKALVIMNGVYLNHAIIGTAVNVAKLSATTLHAFFLTQESQSVQGDYLFPNDLSLTQNEVTGKSIEEENTILLDDNIKMFKALCDEHDVQYVIEPQRDISVKEIINYSAFADFIMADAQSGVYQYRLNELLSDAHCPILLSSKLMEDIPAVVFAYDGSFSSIYAFKMFSYVFPEWISMDTRLVHISNDEGTTLPHEEMIRGWMLKHYPATNAEVLTGKGKQVLIDYLNSCPGNTMVVMGAYGRSDLSRLLHRSLADEVIEKTRAAVFIVHE
jgi:hypothetical protein